MSLSEPFIRRPVGTTLLAIGLFLVGAVAYVNLPVASIPNVDFPMIRVSASRPGADPSVMAATVAAPLERKLGEIAGVDQITSSSSLGTTSIQMQFAIGRSIDKAARDVQAAINASLADLPTIRSYVARMRVKADMASALVGDTLSALAEGRADASLRVLECKAAAGETANEVLDMGMRVCGGAAFRKDVAVERYFRDARASGVMAPTTDVLYDFIGKAVCGMPLF